MSIFEYYEDRDPLLHSLLQDDPDNRSFTESRREASPSTARNRSVSAARPASPARRRDERSPDSAAT